MKSHGREDGLDSAAIQAEAMAWLAERDEGFAPGRAIAFDAWCSRDSRHAECVAELEQLLAQLDTLKDRREEVNTHFGRISPPQPLSQDTPVVVPALHWWRPIAWGGVAAALALGVFLGFRPKADPETRYTTTPAGYERAHLNDGSTLELNTTSAARVLYTAVERRVELESGEAHFEVAHDTSRPFIVSAGSVAVRAVGTAFNVRFVSGAVEVTVTEGKVTVGPRLAGSGTTLLAANERLVISPATAASSASVVEPLGPADMRAVLAWQRRITDFSDTPLAEVVARFNRHNALQIAIEDPALGARRIGGMFALDDVEAFVRLLERDGIIRAERKGDAMLLRAP